MINENIFHSIFDLKIKIKIEIVFKNRIEIDSIQFFQTLTILFYAEKKKKFMFFQKKTKKLTQNSSVKIGICIHSKIIVLKERKKKN